jgi:diaminopropionate ammonia-lyase
VPTGVGSLLQAALQHCRAPDRDPGHGDPRPRVLAVEPGTAACVTRSLATGRPVSVDTSTPTSMAGLNCGTVSELAWPVIDRGLDAAVTVSEAEVSVAVAELDRHGVRVGPCGAAALAGVRAVLAAPDRRAALELHEGSVLLLISTEGRPGEAPASTAAVAPHHRGDRHIGEPAGQG